MPFELNLPIPGLSLQRTDLGKKSHARKRPPGHIPHPRNAFILFRCDFVAQKYVPVAVETDHRNISRIAGKVWQAMSDESRRPWLELAQREKEEHAQKYPSNRYSPVSSTTNRPSRRKPNKKVEVNPSQTDAFPERQENIATLTFPALEVFEGHERFATDVDGWSGAETHLHRPYRTTTSQLRYSQPTTRSNVIFAKVSASSDPRWGYAGLPFHWSEANEANDPRDRFSNIDWASLGTETQGYPEVRPADELPNSRRPSYDPFAVTLPSPHAYVRPPQLSCHASQPPVHNHTLLDSALGSVYRDAIGLTFNDRSVENMTGELSRASAGVVSDDTSCGVSRRRGTAGARD